MAEMSDPELEKILDFDEADLNANRNGSLTERQKTKLTKDEKSTKWLFWILAIVLFATALSPWLLLLNSVVSGTYDWPYSRTPTNYIGPVVWTILWGYCALGSVHATKDKYNYKLLKVQGNINFINNTWGDTHGKRGDNFELHVAKKKFEDIDLRLVDAMGPGDEYAIYYLNDTPLGRIIVSAELLAKKE
jgi:hypothetical protein